MGNSKIFLFPEFKRDPILRAVDSGDPAALEQLLSQGVMTDNFGSAVAMALGDPVMLTVFLKHGLDPNYIFKRFGETLMSRTVCEGHKATFDLLVSRGARIDTVDAYGFGLLHQAAGGGQPELAEILIQRGLDVNARTTTSQGTPLIDAARNNHPAVMEILVRHGADIEARDVDLVTPLIIAAKAGKFEAAEWLVRHGADINAQDDSEKTALDWARVNNHAMVVELLESRNHS